LLSGSFVIPSPLLATILFIGTALDFDPFVKKARWVKDLGGQQKSAKLLRSHGSVQPTTELLGPTDECEDYQEEIYAMFKLYSPTVHRAGIYKDRTSKAVAHYLRDIIFPDVNKFNESLRLIQSSNPTGVNYDNIISMAIAYHLEEKVTRMDYSKKDYDHNKWPNYLAWKILRESPKFRPPSRTEDQQQGGTEIVPSSLLSSNTTTMPTSYADFLFLLLHCRNM
jgi:hypothetical protein